MNPTTLPGSLLPDLLTVWVGTLRLPVVTP